MSAILRQALSIRLQRHIRLASILSIYTSVQYTVYTFLVRNGGFVFPREAGVRDLRQHYDIHCLKNNNNNNNMLCVENPMDIQADLGRGSYEYRKVAGAWIQAYTVILRGIVQNTEDFEEVLRKIKGRKEQEGEAKGEEEEEEEEAPKKLSKRAKRKLKLKKQQQEEAKEQEEAQNMLLGINNSNSPLETHFFKRRYPFCAGNASWLDVEEQEDKDREYEWFKPYSFVSAIFPPTHRVLVKRLAWKEQEKEEKEQEGKDVEEEEERPFLTLMNQLFPEALDEDDDDDEEDDEDNDDDEEDLIVLSDGSEDEDEEEEGEIIVLSDNEDNDLIVKKEEEEEDHQVFVKRKRQRV